MRQLFLIDPIERIRPRKDSSAALMQAAQALGDEVWFAEPRALSARQGAVAVEARQARLAEIRPHDPAESPLPEPWWRATPPQRQSLGHFDVVWMRKDPPVNDDYLFAACLLKRAVEEGVRVVNAPEALLSWNEKLSALRFSTLMAPSLVSADCETLSHFIAEVGDAVLKPLAGRAGQGVLRVSSRGPGIRPLLELVTDQGRQLLLCQAFLPQVSNGDKRILLLDGEPCGAVNRRPRPGEFRSNLAQGGQAEPTALSEDDLRICAVLKEPLRQAGLFFVGIDVIGSHLSEINVTSPTGIREVERLSGEPVALRVQERLRSG